VVIEFTKIKVTVRISPKRPNLYDPSFYLVTTTRYVPWVGFVLPTLRFGRLYEGWNFNRGNYLFTTDTK